MAPSDERAFIELEAERVRERTARIQLQTARIVRATVAFGGLVGVVGALLRI